MMKKDIKFLAEERSIMQLAIAMLKRPNLRKRFQDKLRTKWDLWKLNGSISQPFSINRLLMGNPGLARHYLWDSNPILTENDPIWLHLGCGVNVLEDFVNLDIVPQDYRVIEWNLLDLWPEGLANKAYGVFTEDCIEHFYYAEQIYILCNINYALKLSSVARILMPSLARLIETYNNPLTSKSFLHETYGVGTSGDVFNYGMRFTGHRWLHDAKSLRHMAEICGFESNETSCSISNVEKFNNLNLRDESNSASFANDLFKKRCISRISAFPKNVKGAKKIEDLSNNAELYVATSQRPMVEYELPHNVQSSSIACINFRSSNLSSFNWGLKTLIIDEVNNANPWYFDETLKSQPCMNLITNGQIKVTLGSDRDISKLKFSPAANSGEYFTLGFAEAYILEG
jgi:hypothetical protein